MQLILDREDRRESEMWCLNDYSGIICTYLCVILQGRVCGRCLVATGGVREHVTRHGIFVDLFQ